jgi:dolichol-phosphate mannosyltransferase
LKLAIYRMAKNTLSIVVPVYNEAENFPRLYKEVTEKIKNEFVMHVVYDFDQDTTVPVAKEFQKKDKRVILTKNDLGKGPMNAIKAGFNAVKSGPVLVIMGDVCDDLTSVKEMLKHYDEGSSVVCGSRYMRGGRQIGGPLIKRTLSKLAGNSLYYLRRLPTHDATNNFKLYDKAFLDEIIIESKAGFEIGLELVVKAFCLEKRISEVPTTWTDRAAGESNFKLMKWLPAYLHWYKVGMLKRF